VADFYRDWAGQQFGEAAAGPLGRLFARIDGRLPRPADWVDGPGGIKPDGRPWAQVKAEYQFVTEMAMLGKYVSGDGNRERYQYWLATFQYMEAMAQINCTWAQFNEALARAKKEGDTTARQRIAREQVLPLRKQLITQVGRMYRALLATVSNPGELGTIANWEQHLFPGLLDKPGHDLAEMLGGELPKEAQLSKNYYGATRVIVPAKRTSFFRGEAVTLKVLVLSSTPPSQASLYCRKLGQGGFVQHPLEKVARGVYQVKLPTTALVDDLEYYVEVRTPGEPPARFPATAPRMNQTLVMQAR
jgi:hypothetical protein